VIDDLAVLRQEAMALPEQSQIASVIEAIDFWVPVLKEYTDYAELLEGCGCLSCTRFRRHQVRCFMEQEVGHGETEVHARVQA
jgi:hypothetical protein